MFDDKTAKYSFVMLSIWKKNKVPLKIWCFWLYSRSFWRSKLENSVSGKACIADTTKLTNKVIEVNVKTIFITVFRFHGSCYGSYLHVSNFFSAGLWVDFDVL